ncbi:LysR family transcriptional regulator [Evansella halocellulosilytica]|uniref:LysR family transcriptional regulator n=1 Tax=Evansella halocellulosilytica TaxID=2011013 RepID=UPI000BB69F2A|nr:LysR family transcriptional regulator [Evansella halocellulosilytica]
MEILQLTYFRTLAQVEHMTKAAETLHIAQPALSQAISRLEKDLGVRLFDRKGRQIRLNSYGKLFLERVESALDILEEGRKELIDRAGIERGSIYLATSTFDRLSPPIKSFLDQYPDIHFQVKQASMEKLTHLIHDNDIDFCFTAIPIKGDDIESIPILKEDLYIGVPHGHQLANRNSIPLSEASEEPFISYHKDNQMRQMNEAFCREAGFSPRVVCEAEGPTEIANLVRAGLGIAFVGSCNIDDDLVKLKINEPACERTYSLVWKEHHYLSRAAQQFKDFLIQYFSSN